MQTRSATLSKVSLAGTFWKVTERREKDFGEAVSMNQANDFLRKRRFEEEKAIWLQEMRSDNYIELKL